MSSVPDELVETVRRAATAPSAHGGDLASVRRRAQRRRHRHQVAAVACAAAVAGAAALAVPMLGREPLPPAAVKPAQRLILNDISGRGVGLIAKDPATGHVGPVGAAEVLDDGSVAVIGARQLNRVQSVMAIPDGPVVIVGELPERGGVSRGGLVVAPDGGPATRYDVASDWSMVQLVGVGDGDAYLLHSDGLTARDLATGKEHFLLSRDDLGYSVSPAPVGFGERLAIDVAAGVAALASRCELRIVDLSSRRQRAKADLPCNVAYTWVRISPDGRLAAVHYTEGAKRRLAVVETLTGALRLDQVLETITSRDVLHDFQTPFGMAWTDAQTLRVAWLGPNTASKNLADTLQVRTVPVPQ
jgi:hypothetical protein